MDWAIIYFYLYNIIIETILVYSIINFIGELVILVDKNKINWK